MGTVIFNVPMGVGKPTGAQAVGTGAFLAVGAMNAGTGADKATGIAVGQGAKKAEANFGVEAFFPGKNLNGCSPR